MSAHIQVLVVPELVDGLRQHTPTGWTIEQIQELDAVPMCLVDVHAKNAPHNLDGHVVNPVIARNYTTGEVYVLEYGFPLNDALIAGLIGDNP